MKPVDYIPNYELIAIGEWYKDGYFWRKKNRDGSDGKGDLIFNTCYYKIFVDKDMSDWAYAALEACSVLLINGKRWPDRMNYDDCDSWMERIVSMWLMKLGLAKGLPFRYQGRMTRDPFVAFWTTCLLLRVPAYIDYVTPQWYLYSRETWEERRRLIKDNRKDFVIRMDYLRKKAGVLKFEQNENNKIPRD